MQRQLLQHIEERDGASSLSKRFAVVLKSGVS